MKPARWRTSCNPAWPAAARAWLKTRGSLTVRLQSTYGTFRVEVRRQGGGVVLPDEAGVLGVRSARRVRVRQVTLWAGGQARVVAHSAVRWMGTQSDWPFWRQLGSRSLGSVLFRDHRVQRSRLQFASLPVRHELAAQAERVAGPSARWYARRAVYRRGTGLTPLVVTEVFLNPQASAGGCPDIKD